MEALAAKPVEQRYTWRIASGLKWAFADFENLSIVADRRTLCQEDLDKLVDLLRHRRFSSACSWPPCTAKIEWKRSWPYRFSG
jgi:hypothetical protein